MVAPRCLAKKLTPSKPWVNIRRSGQKLVLKNRLSGEEQECRASTRARSRPTKPRLVSRSRALGPQQAFPGLCLPWLSVLFLCFRLFRRGRAVCLRIGRISTSFFPTLARSSRRYRMVRCKSGWRSRPIRGFSTSRSGGELQLPKGLTGETRLAWSKGSQTQLRQEPTLTLPQQ
jgi:hypothetical protein